MLEADMWKGLGDLLAEGRIFDQGMPKDFAEFLCAATFHAPSGDAVRQEAVSVRLGEREKRLLISGPRYWRTGRATRPEPLASQPIRYSEAFGGEGFPDNPTGKGYARDPQTGERPLPLIEYPGEAVTSPSQTPRPASLEGRDLRWRSRQRYAGTYDETYMRTRMPGLPDDVDWRVFNDAAEDQWFDDFLRGDESFELIHMHPEKPRLSGSLPEVVGRAFVDRKRDPKVKESPTEFEEVPLRLDTVWFAPDAGMGILIHRGTTEVQEDDATDIVRLLAAHENLNDVRRPREHYRTEMARRSDPDRGHLYMLDTSPLIPAGYTCAIQELMANPEGGRENRATQNVSTYVDQQNQDVLEKADEQIDAASDTVSQHEQNMAKDGGVSAAQIGDVKNTIRQDGEKTERDQQLESLIEKVVPGATTGDVDITKIDPDALDEMTHYVQGIVSEEKDNAQQRIRDQIESLRSQNDPESAAITEAIEKLEAALDDQARPAPLPRPQFDDQVTRVREQIEALSQYQDELQQAGVDEQKIKASIPDLSEMEQKLQDAQEAVRAQYPVWAHLAGPSRSPHPGEEDNLRADLLNRARNKKSGTRGDYAFIDLTGVTLRDMDLSEALLEYVDFTGATFDNVNLRGAVLAKAQLVDCVFRNVDLNGANVGAAAIRGSQFSDCDFTGARLSRSAIREACFARCRFEECMEMFLEATFQEVRFTDCVMPRSNWIQLDLTACRFDGCDLTKANFLESDLTRCDFTGAVLDRTNIVSTRAPGARFDRAKMSNVRFIDDPILNDCTFRESELTMANLRSADLTGASFRGAILDQADLSAADLSDTDLSRISAIGAQFRKANLRGASLFRANMCEASLMNAQLRRCRLDGSNLYSVSFLYATLGETSFSGANLDNTILRDWRPIQ